VIVKEVKELYTMSQAVLVSECALRTSEHERIPAVDHAAAVESSRHLLHP
jgi:hypothetical protein